MDNSCHPFPNTHWSLVVRAGQGDPQARSAALQTLLERYLPALRSHLRLVKRQREQEVEELLQSFVADKMLEETFLKHADERRGRFRTFLLTCLNNFAVSRYRAAKLRENEPLGEVESAETENPPYAAVEAAWARALVRDVLRTMETECARTGRMDVWKIFEGRVLADIFGDGTVVPYEELAKRLHLESPMQAANLLVTAKRTYARLLRSAVAEYEREQADQEAEIAGLCEILARCPAVPED
jgi:DNA-directed RNA polymerase specialized sigma24 family protein